MLTLKICRKNICKLFLTVGCIICLCISFACAASVPSRDLDYSTSSTNNEEVNAPQVIEKEADDLFYKGINSKNNSTKEAYLIKSLNKYMLLLSIQPDNAVFATQVGVIHDLLGHKSLAKSYFYRAVNLENLNPFANYYFGEYYFNMKDYRRALKYYTIALNNGYASYYEVHNRLATVYEKLGDLAKAKDYYSVSLVVNPNQRNINKRILLLNKAYYSKKDYRHKQTRE